MCWCSSSVSGLIVFGGGGGGGVGFVVSIAIVLHQQVGRMYCIGGGILM